MSERNQIRYTINGSGTAYNLTMLLESKKKENAGDLEAANELESKVSVDEKKLIARFIKYCSSPEVVEAKRQEDKTSDGKIAEGITTFSVRTKTSKLMIIGIYENNNDECKEQMDILGNAIRNAQERIARRKKERQDKVIKVVGGVTVTVVAGLAIWAGTIKLHDWFGDEDKKEKPTIETTTEAATESTEDYATPIDSTYDESDLESKYSAEDLQKSMEESNKKETEKELEELKQRREDLGLSTDAVGTPEATTEAATEATTDDRSSNDELNLTADEIRASIEKSNQEQMEKQKQYIIELRQSYEDEYKKK